MRPSRAAFIAATGAALALPAFAAAQTPVTLRYIYFPGTDLLPTFAGIAKGFYAREGLTLALTPTPGSVYQFQHLSAGDFDLAFTAMDNIIAYDEGQGQAPLPNPADFVAILGGDNAFLRLYTRADIASFADLRGKTLAVDALTTGFAFVLRSVLEKNGVHDGEYTLQPLGGTPARYAALLDGSVAATILNAPFDLLGNAHGLKQLGDVNATIGPYQGVVTAVRRSWLAANPAAATGYVRGTLAGLRWMYDPANHDEAVQLLVDMGKFPAPVAAAMLPVLTAANGGMDPAGRMDIPGVKTVLALRSRYGVPQKTLTDPFAYYDGSAYLRATK